MDSRETDINVNMYKSIGFFIISILISTFFAVWILIWVSSSIKLAGYFRDITVVYKNFYPPTVEISEDASPVFIGKLPINGSNQINKLITGIDELRKLKAKVRDDYDSGGISESHFRNLLSSTQEALQEFRSTLTRAISNDIKQNNKVDSYLTEETISNYFASSFLDKGQCQMLLDLVNL